MDAAAVKEDFLSVGGPDKTKPSVANKLLYCPSHIHLNLREGGASWHVEKTEGGRRRNLCCALARLYQQEGDLSKHRTKGRGGLILNLG